MWKQPECPSTEDSTSKMPSIHTTGRYSVIKRNALPTPAALWTNPQNARRKDGRHEGPCARNGGTQRRRKQMCGCQGCCQARVLEGGDGCTVLGTPPNCTLEDGYDDDEFMLCILPHKTRDKKTKKPQKSQNKASRASPQASGPDFPAWSFSVPRGCGWGTGWGGGWSWECSRCPLPRDGRHRGDPGCPPPEAGGPKAPERKDRLRARRGRGSRGPALAVATGRRPSAELPLQPPPLEA